MRVSTKFLVVSSLLTVLELAVNNKAVNAASFNFSQTGWTQGGSITGMFAGEDKNDDGILNFSFNQGENEISKYTLELQNNNAVGPFSFELIPGSVVTLELAYNLNTGEFNNGFADAIGAFNYSSTGVIGSVLNGSSDTTDQEAIVTQVAQKTPEASSFIGLLAMGIIGMASVFKIKKQA